MVGAKGHAMTGIAYDREPDTIQVWNPWGNSGHFKEWGVKMEHGFFRMPITDLIEKKKRHRRHKA
jgi:hypothetical protein